MQPFEWEKAFHHPHAATERFAVHCKMESLFLPHYSLLSKSTEETECLFCCYTLFVCLFVCIHL